MLIAWTLTKKKNNWKLKNSLPLERAVLPIRSNYMLIKKRFQFYAFFFETVVAERLAWNYSLSLSRNTRCNNRLKWIDAGTLKYLFTVFKREISIQLVHQFLLQILFFLFCFCYIFKIVSTSSLWSVKCGFLFYNSRPHSSVKVTIIITLIDISSACEILVFCWLFRFSILNWRIKFSTVSNWNEQSPFATFAAHKCWLRDLLYISPCPFPWPGKEQFRLKGAPIRSCSIAVVVLYSTLNTKYYISINLSHFIQKLRRLGDYFDKIHT